jgi:hypothetical protein
MALLKNGIYVAFLVGLVAFPASILFLWSAKKPAWMIVCLIVNGLYFTVQVVAIALALLLYFGDS